LVSRTEAASAEEEEIERGIAWVRQQIRRYSRQIVLREVGGLRKLAEECP